MGGQVCPPWLRAMFGNGGSPRFGAVPRNFFWAVFAIFSGLLN
jgi:hypothetical protein